MAKFKITLDRNNCIGCGACSALSSQFWCMDPDGKSRIVGTKGDTNEKNIEKEDFDINKEVAESCPVNVIHLTDLETDEKII